MQPALRASCAMGFLMAACLVALPLPTSAVVYKWVDENGKVHYGERPPAGVHKQPVKVHNNPGATQSSGAPSTAERLRKQRKLLKAYEADRAEKREHKARLAKQKAALKAHCEKMQKYLQQESSAKYLYRQDKDGNKLPVSDQERKMHIADVRKKFDKHC